MRGRFAPSPSGEMHLGNAWTALMAWLQVRSAGGTMALRIEDLDPDRSRPEYTAQLLQDLAWLGLDWDEGPDKGGPGGPYCQAERRDLYARAMDSLERQGLLYPCYCTRAELREASSAPNGPETGLGYPGTCRNLSPEEREKKQGRKPAWRVKVPTGEIEFNDLCRGQIRETLREVGDFVVRRADGVHAYQLAVVVDDGLMGITHVLRGDDLLPSAARQIFLFNVLGLPVPVYAHVPLLYGPDGRRLSKRHGDVSIASLRRKGVKAEQIIGCLGALAGFVQPGEAAKPEELLPLFALDKIKQEAIVIGEDFALLKLR